MAKLVVKRAKDFSNAARKFTLLLDGKEIGAIAHGGSDMYEVPAGQHVLRAKINWMTSRDFQFDISEGETRYLKISGPPFEFVISLCAILLMVAALYLKTSTGREYPIYILLAFLCTGYCSCLHSEKIICGLKTMNLTNKAVSTIRT